MSTKKEYIPPEENKPKDTAGQQPTAHFLLEDLIKELQTIQEEYGNVPVMLRRTGFTADNARQVSAVLAIPRLEGTPSPPIGQFNIGPVDDIVNLKDMGDVVALIN
jgi:hypothetical protein